MCQQNAQDEGRCATHMRAEMNNAMMTAKIEPSKENLLAMKAAIEAYLRTPTGIYELRLRKDPVSVALVTRYDAERKAASEKEWLDDWVAVHDAARSPSTPPRVLQDIASDEDWSVREFVARNPSTPTELLSILATDQHSLVRESAREKLASRA